MTYCKNYCEEKEISTSELNEAQKTLYYIAENMKMQKSISEEGYRHFQMAIKALEQKPCEDTISRSSLLGKLDDCYKEKIKVAPDNMAEGFVQVEKLIKQEPSVNPTSNLENIIPKNATNGDMLLTMFDAATVYGIDKENDCIAICIDNNFYQKFSYSWWNTPYKESEV